VGCASSGSACRSALERGKAIAEQVEAWGLLTRPVKRSGRRRRAPSWAVALNAIPRDRLVGLVEDAILTR